MLSFVSVAVCATFTNLSLPLFHIATSGNSKSVVIFVEIIKHRREGGILLH